MPSSLATKTLFLFVLIVVAERGECSPMNIRFFIDNLVDMFLQTQKPAASNSFSYKNCGSKSDLVVVNHVELQPDPLLIPGKVKLNTEIEIKQNLTGPFSINLSMAKYLGSIKINIPCLSGYSGCSFSDICAMVPALSCDELFKQTVLPKGVYRVVDFENMIDLEIPILGGVYSFKIEFFAGLNKARQGCLEVLTNIASSGSNDIE